LNTIEWDESVWLCHENKKCTSVHLDLQHVQHGNKKLMESKRPESLFDIWRGLQDEDGFDIIACKGDAT